jgi:hypothetical protein
MDKELTDNETKKALECCCKNNNCEGCPLDYLTFSSQCASELAIKSLDLINRLEAENENWQAAYMTEKQEIANLEIELKAMRGAVNSYKAENERLQKVLDVWKDIAHREVSYVGLAKTEAYKEFAERLKEKFWDVPYETENAHFVQVVDVGDIDNLLKELVGEDNA